MSDAGAVFVLVRALSDVDSGVVDDGVCSVVVGAAVAGVVLGALGGAGAGAVRASGDLVGRVVLGAASTTSGAASGGWTADVGVPRNGP